jgi:hypothetical protein
MNNRIFGLFGTMRGPCGATPQVQHEILGVAAPRWQHEIGLPGHGALVSEGWRAAGTAPLACAPIPNATHLILFAMQNRTLRPYLSSH